MKRLIVIVMMAPLLAGGCASSAVRTLGRVTTFDGPRGVVLWKNQAIGIEDTRYQVTGPFRKESALEARFYVVTPADIAALTNADRMGYVTVPYRQYPVEQNGPVAREIDAILSSAGPGRKIQTQSVDRVWVMSKGFGGVCPMAYTVGDRDLKLRVGPEFSHEVGEGRTTSGKLLQVLLVPAAAVDIVTFPIQFFYFVGRLNEAWQ